MVCHDLLVVIPGGLVRDHGDGRGIVHAHLFGDLVRLSLRLGCAGLGHPHRLCGAGETIDALCAVGVECDGGRIAARRALYLGDGLTCRVAHVRVPVRIRVRHQILHGFDYFVGGAETNGRKRAGQDACGGGLVFAFPFGQARPLRECDGRTVHGGTVMRGDGRSGRQPVVAPCDGRVMHPFAFTRTGMVFLYRACNRAVCTIIPTVVDGTAIGVHLRGEHPDLREFIVVGGQLVTARVVQFVEVDAVVEVRHMHWQFAVMLGAYDRTSAARPCAVRGVLHRRL